MDKTNFLYGLSAICKDIALFFKDIVSNHMFLGFAIGVVAAVLVIGLVLTENPSHLPIILRYSYVDSFKRISEKDDVGVYSRSFYKFMKLHSFIRIISLIAFLIFCSSLVAITLTN